VGECITLEEVDSENPATEGISTALTRELIETWCVTQLQWLAYEIDNAPALWEQVDRHIRGYLCALWASGMLRGNSTKEAFLVKCDRTTMTQTDIRDGNLICEVRVAPVRPSGFVQYRIRVRLKSR
jgi:phage tail sheath protein FI